LPAPGSDVDLCLIVSESSKNRRERIQDYLPVGFPVGVDLFVYSRDEFQALPKRLPGWYRTIMSGIEIGEEHKG
jgi:hypothetical protein